ncbi:MAG: enoyl-CoA hydratase/isomerase family protein [Chloroflexi bacterium]|nr:enoyl-CoA hydratase/isomerase family protein [Chloroflexota bacterium]
MSRAYRTILYEKDEAVPNILYVTLNRPEKNNAISIGETEMTGEIKDAMLRANHDDEVKVVIFRGAGKSFCAGFDLSMVYRVYGGAPGVKPNQRIRLQTDQDQLYGFPQSILDCNKVTIAQVHGWCIEAGLYIVKCCDLAIAAENAKISQRGQRLAFGGLPTLPLELVMGHTKKVVECLLTGRTISGKEAEEDGYVTKAIPAQDLESEVYALATAISVLPRDAIVMGKVSRRHMLERLGLTCLKEVITYHTLCTSIGYTEDERDLMFIRDREGMGEKAAFHKMHEKYEEALNKTKYFKSYNPEQAL